MVKEPVKDKSKSEISSKPIHWLLLAILGAAFLLTGLFPSGKNSGSMNETEQRIASALSRIRDAGDTHVVIYSAETGAFSAADSPTGALIIATGADDIAVQLRLMEAATTLLNLPPDSIRIYPMEENP